jgi:hypothetical protein
VKESEIDELCGMHESDEKLLHMSENLKRLYAVAGPPYCTVDVILNWIRFSCLGFAPVAGCGEHSNKPLGSIQWRKFDMSDI